VVEGEPERHRGRGVLRAASVLCACRPKCAGEGPARVAEYSRVIGRARARRQGRRQAGSLRLPRSEERRRVVGGSSALCTCGCVERGCGFAERCTRTCCSGGECTRACCSGGECFRCCECSRMQLLVTVSAEDAAPSNCIGRALWRAMRLQDPVHTFVRPPRTPAANGVRRTPAILTLPL